MSITSTTQPNLDSLDPVVLASSESFLVDHIKGQYPDLDINPSSVLYQLLIKPAAIYYALNKQYIANVAASNSLNQIEADPTIADSVVVDNILSNYLITRSSGIEASGQVKVVLTSNQYTPISTGIEFSANGITYKPTRAFEGVTSSDQIVTGNEELIEAVGNSFSFNIDLVATSSGVAGNIKKGTTFTTTLNNNNVERVYATGDFNNGKEEETNAELIDKLKQGISTANMGSRAAIDSLIKIKFPYSTDVSVIGAHDPEMKRDQHNVLGISSFGKVDIYTRTRPIPVSSTITKKATLSELNTWVATFTRSECPAAYRITSVNEVNDPTGSTSLDITPYMEDNEGVFTRYQTLVVTFSSDSSGYSVGDTKEFIFTYVALPQIADVSDYVLSRSVRCPGSDSLIKAPIPCFVAIAINIVKGLGEVDPDTDAIKTALCSYINAVDFQTGSISTDAILSVIKGYIGKRSRVKLPLDLRGEIILPKITVTSGNDSYWIFDNNELKLPLIPEYMLSNRTVSFFGLEDNITINVSKSDKLPV